MTDQAPGLTQVSSGIGGLDELLRGGFLTNRMYLVVGGPGSGKTTLGAHFMHAGLDAGETGLFIHGEESATEIRTNAGQFGIDLSDAEFLDLGPDSEFFTEDRSYDLVDPGDIETERHTGRIRDAVREIDPDRLVLDPVTQLRYVEASEQHYRKRLLAFIRFLKSRDITVLGTATIDTSRNDMSSIRSLSDGVIELTETEQGRRINVQKNRGVGQERGDHGMEIRAHGIEVFPRLTPDVAADRAFPSGSISSGVSELDALTGGGFERGTATFITGPSGVGKTTVGSLFLREAARTGGSAIIYQFEERTDVFEHRCRSIGLSVDELTADGRLRLQRIEPLSMSAEEFARTVQRDVATHEPDAVMIDGYTGYTAAIQGDPDELTDDLHALIRYLDTQNVAIFVTDAIHQITGISSATSHNISMLADNLIFLTYIELEGRLSRVIGVLKKRTGSFETTLREFEITSDGVRLGRPLDDLHGVLQGNVRVRDRSEPRSDGGADQHR